MTAQDRNTLRQIINVMRDQVKEMEKTILRTQDIIYSIEDRIISEQENNDWVKIGENMCNEQKFIMMGA